MYQNDFSYEKWTLRSQLRGNLQSEDDRNEHLFDYILTFKPMTP